MSQITIVIPMYNAEKYIEDCLKSLINQKYKDFQVIIINDGSTDKSNETVEKMNLDNRFRIYYQENGGLPSARNAGINRCTTDYIMFLDADDMLDEDTLSLINKEFCNSSYDLFIFNSVQFSKTEYFPNYRYKDEILYLEQNALAYYRTSLDSCCNRVFKMSLIKEHIIRFESKEIVPQEDFYFNFKYIVYCKNIKSISSILYKYRMRLGSITKGDLILNKAMLSLNYPEIIVAYSLKNNINIMSEDFIPYTYLVMLFSIINHKNISKKQIRNVISESSEVLHKAGSFKHHIIRLFSRLAGHKIYFYFIILMIKHNIKVVVSCLEYIRITRFNSISKKTVNHYD